MDDPYSAGLIAILAGIFCIVVSALRGALILYTPLRLKERFGGGRNDARIDAYVRDHDLLVFSATGFQWIGNTVLLLGIFAAFAIDLGEASDWALLTTVLAASILGLYLTNSFLTGPVVRWNAERIAYHGLKLLYPCRLVFSLPFRIQDGVTSWTARIFGHDPETAEGQDMIDEIESAAEEGEREGVLEEAGTLMIKAILKMQENQVSEVMIPRIDIKSVSISSSIDEAASFALAEGHSRIPVFQENMDTIIGILYVKDLLNFWQRSENGRTITIEELMRKPTFVPESMRILDLLRDFKKNKHHMAIAVDEYGGTAGLITIEDILEEIVGEIEDEYDPPTEEPLKVLDDGTADIDAKVHIDEVNSALKINLSESDDFETIGGFIFSTLGKIPNPGDSFVHDNIRFTILDAGERRINRVKLTVLNE